MRRKSITILAVLFGLVSVPAAHAEGAGPVRVNFGLEWGYTATCHMSHHYNCIDPQDGYRIDESYSKFMLNSNGQANLSIGLEYLGRIKTGIHAGYCGIRQDVRLYPVQIRQSYYFRGYDTDSPLVFIGGGVGFNEKNGDISKLGHFGGGYRLSLNQKTSIDFISSFNISTDHPEIKDKTTGAVIPSGNVFASDALLLGINFSIALNF